MIDHIVVVVPAADEEQLIGRCLAALNHAAAELERTHERAVRVRTVVVLDGCRDGTASVVRRHPEVESIATSYRRVGAARRAGAEAGLRGGGSAPTTWLASTDADSQVPSDWLLSMVRAADDGADVLLGTVVPDELDDDTLLAWSAEHKAVDGHPHVHGANLGIRASTYLQVGGWTALLPVHEDADLAERARRAGAVVRSVGGRPVRTSARRVNRVPGGFAGYLRDLQIEAPRVIA